MDEAQTDIIENLELLMAPDPHTWMIPTVGVLSLLLLSAVVVWWLYRRRKLPFQEPAPIPPDVVALREFERIRPMLESEDDRTIVVEVSRVLRYYIEGRFAIRAPRLSTEEFLYLAEHDDALDSEQQAVLARFLMQCDRVKFARDHLANEMVMALFEMAVTFVHQTREVTPAAEESLP